MSGISFKADGKINNCCPAYHTREFRGPFRRILSELWWIRHYKHGVTHECDTCHNEYKYEPSDSFQTYNGTWFCSDECGKKAGW